MVPGIFACFDLNPVKTLGATQINVKQKDKKKAFGVAAMY